LANPQRMK